MRQRKTTEQVYCVDILGNFFLRQFLAVSFVVMDGNECKTKENIHKHRSIHLALVRQLTSYFSGITQENKIKITVTKHHGYIQVTN